jgi:hypothetical protein
LLLCAQSPHDTADILRHLFTGLAVLRDGVAGLAAPLAAKGPAMTARVPWAEFAYNYPAGAVAFFCGIAGLQPTVMAAKIALTSIEAVNSLLVGRITGSALAGLAYWALPLSAWWVSHEGQFEPVQTLPVLLGWSLLRQHPGWAGAMLSAAFQVKLTAVLLLPCLLAACWSQQGGKSAARLLLGFLLALAPSLALATQYPMVRQVFVTSAWPVRFNPWHFALPPYHRVWWMPVAYVSVVKLALVAILTVLALAACRRRTLPAVLAYAAPAAFVGLALTAGVFQPWYWLVFVSFLPTLPAGKSRLMLCGLVFAAEPLCLWQLTHRPIGPDNFPAAVTPRERLALP